MDSPDAVHVELAGLDLLMDLLMYERVHPRAIASSTILSAVQHALCVKHDGDRGIDIVQRNARVSGAAAPPRTQGATILHQPSEGVDRRA
jgi:hypothetical protein